MRHIPDKYVKSDLFYRSYNEGPFINFMGAGFLKKDGIKVDFPYKHYHHFALVYVLRGRGIYKDNNLKEHVIQPGTVFLRSTHQAHSLVIDPSSKWLECFIALKFTKQDSWENESITEQADNSWLRGLTTLPDLTPEILGQLGVVDLNKPVIHPGVNLEFVDRFDRVIRNMKTATKHKIRLILMDALKLGSDMYGCIEQDKSSNYEETLVEKACQIIQKNLYNRTPLPELLTEVGISYSRIRALFKKIMGMSPGNYQIQRRIDKAYVLFSKGYSVQEVALELGYSDQFAFSAQFKKFTGTSPKDLKKG